MKMIDEKKPEWQTHQYGQGEDLYINTLVKITVWYDVCLPKNSNIKPIKVAINGITFKRRFDEMEQAKRYSLELAKHYLKDGYQKIQRVEI